MIGVAVPAQRALHWSNEEGAIARVGCREERVIGAHDLVVRSFVDPTELVWVGKRLVRVGDLPTVMVHVVG